MGQHPVPETVLLGQAVDRLAIQRDALRNAAEAARAALAGLPQTCQYHGDQYYLGGMYAREPRCDSCKQPYRVRRAIAVIDTALRITAPPSEVNHG